MKLKSKWNSKSSKEMLEWRKQGRKISEFKLKSKNNMSSMLQRENKD